MPVNTAPRAPAPALDTRYHVETPEGIDLILRPAGLIPRALAFIIDLVVRGVLLTALYSLLSLLGDFGTGLATILLFLVTWWYMVLFEVLNQGRSPGKQLMKLRVVHDDGTPVGWAASLTRNLLRFVDMLPFAYTLGIISCLTHPAFKRLGDIAAGTLVVYAEIPLAAPEIPEAEILIPPFALNLAEQRALLGYAERSAQLTAERRLELAAILSEPLKVSSEDAEKQIHGIARGLMGPT